MKVLFLFIVTFIFLSCNTRKTTDPEWLAGHWQRTNDKPGQTSFEQWQKLSDKEYTGTGFTLQETDTVFKENLRIFQLNGVWNYEVSGVHQQPVLFAFTSQSDKGFICENTENDFPKKIKYDLQGETLTAVISAGDKKIPFTFIKQPE